MAFGAVTGNSIATGAVASNSIAAGAVTDAKITGPISPAKLDLSTVVSKSGDNMSGTLNLPANGLTVGTNQLIASGGNVGIGTASPATSLDVNGSARVSDALSAKTYHVPGAGLNSGTSVFIHKVDTSRQLSSNICGVNNAATVIDNPIIYNRADAILFVTMNYGPVSNPSERNGPVFAVSYDDTGFCGYGAGRWVVYSVDTTGGVTPPPPLKNGALFNVMAILP